MKFTAFSILIKLFFLRNIFFKELSCLVIKWIHYKLSSCAQLFHKAEKPRLKWHMEKEHCGFLAGDQSLLQQEASVLPGEAKVMWFSSVHGAKRCLKQSWPTGQATQWEFKEGKPGVPWGIQPRKKTRKRTVAWHPTTVSVPARHTPHSSWSQGYNRANTRY